MRVLRRTIECRYPDEFPIFVFGDIHLGSNACDEALLQRKIAQVANTPRSYFILMGDMLEAIQRNDPRFDPAQLAPWLLPHLSDLIAAQVERLVALFKPIGDKCLAIVEGNHEASQRLRERDVFGAICAGIAPEAKLGYSGYLVLRFLRDNGSSTHLTINLHHGYASGRLAGAKALTLQRHLWTHQCDVAILAHSHSSSTQIEAVECVTSTGVGIHQRYGLVAGSFVRSSAVAYAERKGLLPQPTHSPTLLVKPFHHGGPRPRIRVLS